MTMKTDISSMSTKLEVMANDLKYIKKALDGNGEPGLLKDTRMNTEHRIMAETRNKMTRYAIGSGWVLVIIFLALTISGVI